MGDAEEDFCLFRLKKESGGQAWAWYMLDGRSGQGQPL
jgi:hypothetical protein